MKTKSYLNLFVTDKQGNKFRNPLKLSEAYLISKIAKENFNISVTLYTVSDKEYKSIFG
jgi:hypothetical protein